MTSKIENTQINTLKKKKEKELVQWKMMLDFFKVLND